MMVMVVVGGGGVYSKITNVFQSNNHSVKGSLTIPLHKNSELSIRCISVYYIIFF